MCGVLPLLIPYLPTVLLDPRQLAELDLAAHDLPTLVKKDLGAA